MTIRSAQVTIGALACLLTSSWTNAQTMKPFRSPGLPADGAALPGAPREVPRGTDPAAGQRLYSATSPQANANLPVQTLDVPGGGGPRHAVLGPGDDLLPGNYIYIGDDFANPQAPPEFILLLQVDGNLVLYQANGSEYEGHWAISNPVPLTAPDGTKGFAYPMWATHTNGKSVARLSMQTDGNLVLYDYQHHPVWASGTNGHPGAYLVIQKDGNAVIYKGITPLWATNTVGN
jgi:hypothetical protein